MPRGFLGDYARKITGVTEEVEVVEIHIQWCHLTCGHTMRFTGHTVRKTGGRINCTHCEFEAKAAALKAPPAVEIAKRKRSA